MNQSHQQVMQVSTPAIVIQGDETRPEQPLYLPLLEEKVIRLVELAPGSWNEPVSIRLFIAELQHAPEYDALSYVWGNPPGTSSIQCNGRRLNITLNLSSALKRIRFSDHPRIVWIDAICINQKNTEEKSHHVAFMGDVYRNAKKVLVYIGRDTDGGAEDVASLVSDVCEMVSKFDSITDMPILENNDPWYDDPRWKAVAVLQNLPWFTRAWVIQEVGLAKDPRVLYGHVEISYRDLMKLAAWTRRAPNLDTRAGVGFYSIHIDWADWSSEWRTTATYPDNNLVDLINQARWLGCVDPRDHIYSLLGHPLAMMDDGTTPIVDPDYSKDDMQVWLELAVKLLDKYGIQILSAVEHNEDHIKGDYPSWVPWCWPEEFTECTLGAYEAFYYRADGGVRATTGTVVDDYHRLHVQGVQFDVIKECYPFTADDLGANPEKLRSMAARREGNFADAFDESANRQLSMYRVWDQVRKFVSESAHAYGDAWLTAFSLSLVAGLTAYDCAEDDIERHHRDFKAYFCLWLQGVLGLHMSEVEESLLMTDSVSVGREGAHSVIPEQDKADLRLKNGDAERFYTDFKLMSWGRSFFFTERGYFGIGPCNMKEQDVVCILLGAKCPFVLRRWSKKADEEQFKLVQDCYVHGIMRGEATESCKKEKEMRTRFIIC